MAFLFRPEPEVLEQQRKVEKARVLLGRHEDAIKRMRDAEVEQVMIGTARSLHVHHEEKPTQEETCHQECIAQYRVQGGLGNEGYPLRWYDAFVPDRYRDNIYHFLGDRRYRAYVETEDVKRTMAELEAAGEPYAAGMRLARQVRHARRMVIRDCILLLVYLGLLATPVVSQLTWSPVMKGDCSGQPSSDASCTVQPHSKIDLWYACVMLLLAKVLTIDISDGMWSVLKQFGGMVAAAEDSSTCRGWINWILAIVNNLCTLSLVACQVVLDYEGRFTDSELSAVAIQEAGRSYLILVKDTAHVPSDPGSCLHFDDYEGLAAAAQNFYGGWTLLLFMVGALSLSLGEIMKMKADASFLLKDWVNLEDLLQQNSALQNSQWMQDVKQAQAAIIDGVDAAQAQKQDAVAACVTCCGLCSWQKQVGEEFETLANEELDKAFAPKIEHLWECVDRRIHPQKVVEFILQADLDAITWPFALQAFAFTLFLPLDYVTLKPCIEYNHEVDTTALFGFLELGGRHGGNFVPVAQLLGICVVSFCLAMFLLGQVRNHLCPNLCSCFSAATVIFWAIVLYTVAFGSFIADLKKASEEEEEGRRLADAMDLVKFSPRLFLSGDVDWPAAIKATVLRWIGFQPLDFTQMLLAWYFLQYVYRQVALKTKYFKPGPKETKEFEEKVINPTTWRAFDEVSIEVMRRGTNRWQMRLASAAAVKANRQQQLQEHSRRSESLGEHSNIDLEGFYGQLRQAQNSSTFSEGTYGPSPQAQNSSTFLSGTYGPSPQAQTSSTFLEGTYGQPPQAHNPFTSLRGTYRPSPQAQNSSTFLGGFYGQSPQAQNSSSFPGGIYRQPPQAQNSSTFSGGIYGQPPQAWNSNAQWGQSPTQ